ncbi:E3 ubiquitin-protein ligase TRIM47-like [Parambassis ranga]|uniref:E3 ubiquitin-protein ligase TRIM47-like n=1 Tax=Parambassis ranga TaxID=210632 RepID=A0A6P7IAE3_9TELE|nr:E3 ubiquitin-protein ligase TRIM47-like [Parambassis ranga]XP_028261660.1 E3 ubiquitin-protein ligase TRIM47-like [Parambassis ranga]XP_028261661.1 E3 ubiquitin-protein ligase TRIM47-like [Parambassis ranga]
MSEPPQCCICLAEFSSPASLPCGHSFCLGCIGEYWRIQPVCQCPLCKAFFPARPQLRTDTPQTEDVPLRAGEVACDSCPGKAVKSCLVCLASYCASHLEPHYQQEDLGRHLLVSVEKNLEDSVCKLHGRQLEKFCRSDQTCICIMCVQTEHRGHRVVSVSKEAARKKVKLKRRSMKLHQTIEERLSKAEKIKLLGGENPDKVLISQLKDEAVELQWRDAELEELSQTEDNVRFLQGFTHSSMTERTCQSFTKSCSLQK